MKKNKLRGLVFGAGFAGQGHVEAFRSAGVEIVGMVSRTESVVKKVAQEMNISYASTDWEQALVDLKPDIVSIGTPGGAHYKEALSAIAHGCHVLCDKPLAATPKQAKEMARAAQNAGIKNAYAASYRYQPHALLAKELVAAGSIGDPQEVECISHYNLNPLTPFSWSHRLNLGGGRLNNNFTHKLSIVLHVLDGEISMVSGDVRNDMHRAPVMSGVHDFRERDKFAPDSADDPDLEWEPVDAEWSFTVMARIRTYAQQKELVSALFKHSALHPRFQDDYVAFYGSNGAIYIQGSYAQGPLFVWDKKESWREIPLPKHIREFLPEIKDDTQRNWTQLVSEFVADIQGEGYSGYQTFADGAKFQVVIQAVRDGRGWVTV